MSDPTDLDEADDIRNAWWKSNGFSDDESRAETYPSLQYAFSFSFCFFSKSSNFWTAKRFANGSNFWVDHYPQRKEAHEAYARSQIIVCFTAYLVLLSLMGLGCHGSSSSRY
jgi:hypothetical protein